MLMLACIVLVASLQFPELSSTMVVTVTGLCSRLTGSVLRVMLPVASNEITERVSIVPEPLLVVCAWSEVVNTLFDYHNYIIHNTTNLVWEL